jgi:hypothetical protein
VISNSTSQLTLLENKNIMDNNIFMEAADQLARAETNGNRLFFIKIHKVLFLQNSLKVRK